MKGPARNRRLLSCLVLAATALFGSSPALLAQREPIPSVRHDLSVDSGYRNNKGTREAVVFSQVIRFPKSLWIRLYFDKTNLPPPSKLRLTSLDDKAVQYHDALSLRDYGNSSACFSGDAVKVELVAGALTKANRVLVVAADEGLPGGLGVPETICGTRDKRVQSTDKRQGRLSTGCTGWLISDDVMVTAGHCTNSSTLILSFNVPNSSSTGSTRPSHPDDQYPVVGGTLSRMNGGIGKDWAVARLAKNSNTGKLPGVAQGSYYSLGTVPTSTSGQNIRITGYGTTSPRNYLSQVQKTHVGPLYGIPATPTALYYRTDTSGGNSGSPVVHENTGKAVGIHTHGGCRSTVPTSFNLGTRIDRGDLQVAIQNLKRKGGKFEVFGSGCAGTLGIPKLVGENIPDIGQNVGIVATSVPANSVGLLILGISRTFQGTTPLPINLTGIGMTGCFQLVSLDLILSMNTTYLPLARATFTIPNNPLLVGKEVFWQYVVSDKGSNPADTVVSNGLRLLIGG